MCVNGVCRGMQIHTLTTGSQPIVMFGPSDMNGRLPDLSQCAMI